jgi:hypothetical protein
LGGQNHTLAGVQNRKSLAPPGFKPSAIQPVESHNTNYIILAPLLMAVIMEIIVFWNLNPHSIAGM